MKFLPQRSKPPANIGWHTLAECWEAPRALADRVWSAIRRSSDPRAVTLAYHFAAFEVTDRRQRKRVSTERCRDIIDRVCAPERLVAILEDAVERRLLSRQDCSAFEEHMFTLVTKDGLWKTFDEEPKGA